MMILQELLIYGANLKFYVGMNATRRGRLTCPRKLHYCQDPMCNQVISCFWQKW